MLKVMREKVKRLRAIDVQLDIEGFDKNSQEYYDNLNSRLQKVFTELVSTNEITESKKKGKSSNIVTPSGWLFLQR